MKPSPILSDPTFGKKRATSKAVCFLSLALLLSASTLWAQSISRTRIVNRNKAGNGTLMITINGKERLVEQHVHKAWLIDNSATVAYTLDGGTIRDNHTHLLMRYSPFEPNDGQTTGQKLIGRFSEIDGLRVSNSRSGKAALIVTGMVDDSTVRTVFIVHPRRGVVWRAFNSRVVGLRNGRAVVAQYNPEQDAPSSQPIRVLYLDLDRLLKAPVIQSSIDKSLPAGD